MTKKGFKKHFKIIEAWANGADIEYYSNQSGYWKPARNLDWSVHRHYRVAPTPDTIDWSHVTPEYKWMSRNLEGIPYLFVNRPQTSCSFWYSCSPTDSACAVHFSSYKRGTADWKDSLVERPNGV